MNNVNPVINGLLAAMTLQQTFNRMNIEREAVERQKSRDKRNDEIENFQIQTGLLNSGAKPVDASGTYDANILAPDFDGAAAAAGNPMDVPIRQKLEATKAPVDPNRVVTAPGGRGEYYIPTRDELFVDEFGRKMTELKAVTDVKTQAAIQTNSAKFNNDLLLQGYRDLNAMDRVTATNKSRETVADKNNTTRREEGAANRTNQRDIVSFRETNANARNAASNATSTNNSIRADETRKEIASGKVGGKMTDAAKRKELQNIEAEEYGRNGRAGIHQQLENIGIALRTGKVKDSKGEEVELTGVERAQLEAKAKLLQTRKQLINKRKYELGYSQDPAGIR